jgi:hypothetical protein
LETAIKDGKVWPLQTKLNTMATIKANVTNVDSTVLVANPLRKFLQLTNDDNAGIIYVSFGTGAAVVGSGIRLGYNGGVYIATRENLWAGEVHAIASVAGPIILSIVEGG